MRTGEKRKTVRSWKGQRKARRVQMSTRQVEWTTGVKRARGETERIGGQKVTRTWTGSRTTLSGIPSRPRRAATSRSCAARTGWGSSDHWC